MSINNESEFGYQPLVSIIIPSYNYGHLISETLSCLKAQEYDNWEAIVIDDGSTDETKTVVSNFVGKDERIKYFYQENLGLSAARNTGLSKVTGKYISFLDADDLISKKKIATQVAFMQGNEEIEISYTAAKYFHSDFQNQLFDNIDLKIKKKHRDKSNSNTLKALIAGNITPVNTPMIQRDFLVKNALTFNTDLKSLEDWDFWLKCAFLNAKFYFIKDDDVFALIRVHDISMSSNRKNMRLWELELRKLILVYIEASSLNKQELIKINEKAGDKLIRAKMQEMGIFNFKGLYSLSQEIGKLKTLELFIKELNTMRKEGIKS